MSSAVDGPGSKSGPQGGSAGEVHVRGGGAGANAGESGAGGGGGRNAKTIDNEKEAHANGGAKVRAKNIGHYMLGRHALE